MWCRELSALLARERAYIAFTAEVTCPPVAPPMHSSESEGNRKGIARAADDSDTMVRHLEAEIAALEGRRQCVSTQLLSVKGGSVRCLPAILRYVAFLGVWILGVIVAL